MHGGDNKFTIDQNTGLLKTSMNLDREIKSHYSVSCHSYKRGSEFYAMFLYILSNLFTEKIFLDVKCNQFLLNNENHIDSSLLQLAFSRITFIMVDCRCFSICLIQTEKNDKIC